ncbi:MAG: PIG-L family deacetylase [Verrucomicrobiales bacterium]|nr:PIG-L family deacetylase [Verrucomicrobiales bacterium]
MSLAAVISAGFLRGAEVHPLKIVCVGGHPDDPESGCAGTLARYGALGHSVTVIYLTRGERGIRGKTLDEAAQIRTAECEAACKIMAAKAVFAGQIDGATELNHERVDAFTKLLAAEAPDLIFTHWPVDTHMDHQIASLLAQRAAMALTKRPQIYFFEVNTGRQSQGFAPNVYVDTSSVLEKKKAALFAHKSQDGESIWRDHHEPVAKFRGREAGVPWAEAFVHLNRDNRTGVLPGLELFTSNKP